MLSSSFRWDEEARGKLTSESLHQYYWKQGYAVGDKVYDTGFTLTRHKHGGETIIINLGGSFTADFDNEQV